MSNERIENNRVCIKGRIVSEFTYSHEVYEERFYKMDICIQRTSGRTDIVPLMVSEKLVDVEEDYNGCIVSVSGQFRSYNQHKAGWRRLVLSVFVQEIKFLEDGLDEDRDDNQIFLDGFICKKPVYRKTPLGREIADVLLAVNRSYGKSDYIPCIVWGRNAKLAARLSVRMTVSVQGRIQSREYTKKSQIQNWKYGGRMKCLAVR